VLKICKYNTVVLKFFLLSNGETSQKVTKTAPASRILDAYNISARGYVRHIRLSAGWLQNYFNIIQTTNTFKNRNAIPYNLRIFTRDIFSLKSAEK